MRFDIFDQPSSPSRHHDDLPADFDRSFGSSMSLGSSVDLPRSASNGSYIQHGQQQHLVAGPSNGGFSSSMTPGMVLRSSSPSPIASPDGNRLQAGPSRLSSSPAGSRRSSPTTNRTLGAAMGTDLNSKSPRLAAKMSSPHYMDISPAPKSFISVQPTPVASTSARRSTSPLLPPGSAMKEDTPPERRKMSSRPSSRQSSRPNSRRGTPELGASASSSPSSLGGGGGNKLGRLFGTSISTNIRRDSSPLNYQDNSFDVDASFEREQPPAKKRPASLPLGEGKALVRPPLKSAGLLGIRPSSSLLDPHGDSPQRRSSSESLRRPLERTISNGGRPRSRPSSSGSSSSSRPTSAIETSSFAASIAARQEAMGLSSYSGQGSYATIIESPSPGTFEKQDFGSYFLDPQSPEMMRAPVPSGSSSSLGAGSGFGARPFLKSHTSAVLPTSSSFQSHQLDSGRSLLGKRSSAYSRRPSLAQIQAMHGDEQRAHQSAGAVPSAAPMLRPTAPAPRRWHSSFDGAAMRPPMLPPHRPQQGGSSLSTQIMSMLSDDVDTSNDGPDAMFDVTGSPVAATNKTRSTARVFADVGADHSSPLGYEARRAVVSIDPTSPLPMMVVSEDTSTSPFGGFGASERSGKILPCFTVKEDGLMRITPQTLFDVMKGDFNNVIEDYTIVDCRFGYEYEGGHIPKAINLSSVEAVKGHFLTSSSPRLPPRSQSGKPDDFGNLRKRILIFHCEFSMKRAPTMALSLRQADRSLASDYPNCHYPEVYIMEGGYSRWFKTFSSLCEPRQYVEMDDPRFLKRREEELNGFRRQFNRHKSFAYGDGAAAGRALQSKLGAGTSSSQPVQSLQDDSFDESSFDADSPSNVLAVRQHQQILLSQTSTANIPSASNRASKHQSQPSFSRGGDPEDEAQQLAPSDSMGDTSIDSSFDLTNEDGSGLGGQSSSPCAAVVGSRRQSTEVKRLSSQQTSSSSSGTGGGGGLFGGKSARRPFLRAGTTGGLFGRG